MAKTPAKKAAKAPAKAATKSKAKPAAKSAKAPAKAASKKPAKAVKADEPAEQAASKASDVETSSASNAAPVTSASSKELPERLLTDLSWSLSKQRYDGAAELVTAVRAYHDELGRECSWEPDEIVLPVPSLDLEFVALENDKLGDAAARVNTANPRGFTAAELLWRIHETLASYELSDKKFFEGLTRNGGDERPTYRLHQGS